MQHQEFEPPEALRDTIKCFWHDTRDFGAQQSSIEVIPDGYAEIIFYFGSGCSMDHQGTQQLLPSPFLIGLLNQPVHFYARGRFEIIGIRCFPWTVFDLLGLQAGKDGVRIFEHPVSRLQSPLEELISADKTEEAVTLVTQYFLNKRSTMTTNSMLSKAGTAMRLTNGTQAVSEVAAAAHATIRTLERKFKQSSGHTVKDISGLMRFEQVRNRLLTDPDASLAGIAQEFAYTDQAHLSKEFKRYSGTSPAAFARKTKQEKTDHKQ